MSFPSSMRRWIAALFLLSLSLAAVAAVVVTRFEGPPIDTTAALVPAEAAAYFSFFVDPSSLQKRSLASIVGDTEGEADVASLVEGLLDRVTRAYGLPYEEVRPWIDRQMAFFALGSGAGAVIVEIADQEAAREAVERVGGIVFGDHAVFGDVGAVNAVRRVVRDSRSSLAGPDSFLWKDAIVDVPQDRLAMAMAGGGELSSRAIDLAQELDPLELLLGVGQGNAVSLRATDAGLTFDGYSYSDGAVLLLTGTDPKLKDLGSAGRDTWLGVIVPNLSAAAEAIDRELRQVGRLGTSPIRRVPLPNAVDAADQVLFWVGGRSAQDLSAGMDVTVEGPKGAGLVRALARLGPGEPTVESKPERVRAVYGDTDGRLSDNARYAESVEWLGDLTPIGYVDLEASRWAAAALRLGGFPFPAWLEDVDRVAVGLDPAASPTHWRVVASLRD